MDKRTLAKALVSLAEFVDSVGWDKHDIEEHVGEEISKYIGEYFSSLPVNVDFFDVNQIEELI